MLLRVVFVDGNDEHIVDVSKTHLKAATRTTDTDVYNIFINLHISHTRSNVLRHTSLHDRRERESERGRGRKGGLGALPKGVYITYTCIYTMNIR